MTTPVARSVAETVPTRSAAAPLFALAIGAFGIGTTEFSPMGMLPTIADGVGVSIPTAGLLISAYAIGVMIAAPLMTLGLGRLRNRDALMLLMAIFALGNLLSAIAPGYAFLLFARIVTSLAHGAFFGIGAVVAASLVSEQRRASAMAMMFSGLTVANIGGVPAAAWLGGQIGWRAVFAGIAVVGGITIAALLRALPRGTPRPKTDIAAELRVFRRGRVLNALATTVCGASAMFALYTYVAPLAINEASASAGRVTFVLFLIGAGFTVGNILGGKLADRSIDKTLCFFLALLGVDLLAIPIAAPSFALFAFATFVFGVAAFGVVPPVQMRVMRVASDAAGLASSVNIGAFNLGNAIGAAIGSVVLRAGGSYGAISRAGAVAAFVGVALVAVSMVRSRKSDS
jgi:DHA1 family inner membrane transport protein